MEICISLYTSKPPILIKVRYPVHHSCRMPLNKHSVVTVKTQLIRYKYILYVGRVGVQDTLLLVCAKNIICRVNILYACTYNHDYWQCLAGGHLGPIYKGVASYFEYRLHHLIASVSDCNITSVVHNSRLSRHTGMCLPMSRSVL